MFHNYYNSYMQFVILFKSKLNFYLIVIYNNYIYILFKHLFVDKGEHCTPPHFKGCTISAK